MQPVNFPVDLALRGRAASRAFAPAPRFTVWDGDVGRVLLQDPDGNPILLDPHV